jgi:hypothetical protein
MTSGYSGTPLVRKLGIREGMTCAFLDAPVHYRTLLTGLPENLTIIGKGAVAGDGAVTGDRAAGLDFVHLFVDRADGLMERLRGLRARIVANGIIWVSWPKKASGVATDVTESVVREAGLAASLVDVKICAVDETWSGLKFVIRRSDRPS